MPYWETLNGVSMENPIPITGIWNECVFLIFSMFVFMCFSIKNVREQADNTPI